MLTYTVTWSHTALYEYLYGIRASLKKDSNGNIVQHIEYLTEHNWNGKTIPSNFFSLPDSENISAVLFTNSATITKFNRMGKLAGLGSKDVRLIRQGFLYNPDPNAFEPIKFSIDVDDDDYEESWSDSIMMFHNPNAIHPVNPDCFSDISHHFWDSKRKPFKGIIQPYEVISSITLTISSSSDKKMPDEK